jgi:hypothetical protein
MSIAMRTGGRPRPPRDAKRRVSRRWADEGVRPSIDLEGA